MELLLKNPINLKTTMPNVGYAFEYLHCYNDIQTVLTTVSALSEEDQTASNLKLLLTVTDLCDWHRVFKSTARQYSKCLEYIRVCF